MNFLVLLLTALFFNDIPEAKIETDSIRPLLNQSYTYLGEGHQMTAYASEDGHYVLKLFKATPRHHFKWRRLWRTPAQKRMEQIKWKQSFADTCRRYKLAFIHLKEETGLVFLHFEKSQTPLPLTLKHKKTQTIDLSTLPFVIQKRAILAPDYFRQNPHLKEDGKEALKAFFTKRLSKGFSDPRQTLSKNYGFIGHTPIQIDPGKIEPFDQDPQRELEKIHAHVEEWVLRF